MRRNRRKTIRMALLMLILLLGIGFAALTANLKINGTVDVSRTAWDVHFENVQITNGSVTANPAPTSDDTTTTEMSYTINFTKPGDFFEFTVDMVNDGTIDAMVDVVSNNAYANAASTTPITLPTYLTSTVTYDDGVQIAQNQELLHGTSEKIKVRVEFRTDINPSDLPSSGDTSVVFKFNGTFKQADDESIPIRIWTLPTGKTKDNLQFGDEICLVKDTTQCFNFLHYDGTNNEDIVMLAKYNLKVGNIYDTSAMKIGEYTNDDPEYGKQSSEARGWLPRQTWKGIVAFTSSNSNYWYDGSGLKPEYGNSYPADVYDTNYNGAPEPNTYGHPTNPNYSIAYYVDAYKTILTNYKATIKEARLLTYDEATDSSIGCNESTLRCLSGGFITETSFWLGSVKSNDAVWAICSGEGYFDDYHFNLMVSEMAGGFGVRPVIVVTKSNI